MKRDCPDIHRRKYFPDTDSSYLFKPEQPEFVKPLNHVSVNFVKMDFTQQGKKNPQMTIIAQENESRMRVMEQVKKEREKEFWKLTQERAARIRREMKREQALEKKEVIFLCLFHRRN